MNVQSRKISRRMYEIFIVFEILFYFHQRLYRAFNYIWQK